MKKRKVTTTTVPYCACCKKLVDAKRRKRDTVCQCHDEERHPAATPKTPSSAEDAGHWRARMKEILSSTTDLVKIGSVLLHLTLSRASHEDTVDHALGLASHQSPATKKLSEIFKKTSELIHRLQVDYYYVIPLFSFGKDYPECTLNFCKHAGFIETYTREFKCNVLEHLTQLEEANPPVTTEPTMGRSLSQVSLTSSTGQPAQDVHAVAELAAANHPLTCSKAVVHNHVREAAIAGIKREAAAYGMEAAALDGMEAAALDGMEAAALCSYKCVLGTNHLATNLEPLYGSVNAVQRWATTQYFVDYLQPQNPAEQNPAEPELEQFVKDLLEKDRLEKDVMTADEFFNTILVDQE